MTTRSLAYDNAVYLARQQHCFPAVAAGVSGVTSKFVAFTALNIYSLTANAVAVGATTSTANLWNGTATQTSVGADSVSLIRIMNNAAIGAAPALSTATYGPFSVNNSPAGSTGVSTATTTNGAAGYTNNVQLYGIGTTGQLQAGAPAGNGGIQVNQGDQLYVLRGTDASAVTAVAIEFSITPLASVSN